jgi:hypothetical protein
VSRLSGDVDESTAHGGRWLSGAWAAVAVDDFVSLSLLVTTPVKIMRGSSSTSDPYYEDFIEAVEAWYTRNPDASPKLFHALEGTDPNRLQQSDPKRVLNIDVPTMEVFHQLMRGDSQAFDAALLKALERHKSFWGAGKRRNEEEGFLALGPLALARTAIWQDMQFSTTSDYTPPALLRRPLPETPVVLCPYCLIPMAEGTEVCPACMRDTRKDAPIEMEIPEFQSARRKQCPACHSFIGSLAVVCPQCRSAQP